MRPVRRRPHFVSLTVFSALWFSLVFISTLIFSSPANAVVIDAVRVNSGNGVVFDTTVRSSPGTNFPSAPRKYHNLPSVVMKPQTLGKLARGAVGGPLGLAITGAMLYYGWQYNSETGEFERQTEGTILTQYWSSFSSSTSYRAPDAIGSCLLYASHLTSNSSQTADPLVYSCGSVVAQDSDWKRFTVTGVGESRTQSSTYTARLRNGEYVVEPETEIATDIDLAEAVKTASQSALGTALAVQLANQLLQQSTESQLEQEWPELKEAMQRLTNALATQYAHLQDPETAPPPTQEDLDISDPLVTGNDWPLFCQWAAFLCEPFIGGDQPDVPMLDLEAPEYDSGLPTAGTCPQPYTFNTGFTGPMEISFQPACDLATAIRTPLIAISYLMAGFIVVGVRR